MANFALGYCNFIVFNSRTHQKSIFREGTLKMWFFLMDTTDIKILITG